MFEKSVFFPPRREQSGCRLTDMLPVFIFVLSGKGGVGKTLFSLATADLFDLNRAPIDVVQIDDQDRLAKALARDVTTIEIGLLKKARKDPGVLTAAFHPLYAKIEAMPISDRSLLVDVGATQQHLLADYAGLTGLDEDLREFGIRTCAFIPVVADPESIQQAVRQLAALIH